MTLQLSSEWFTETWTGSALSMKIKAKLHEEQSPFQRIEIYETEKFGNLMVIDGFIMLTQFDNFLYHEMMSHPVLFTHPQPKDIVIIGGGDCGTLKEVLKHESVEHVTQVDIDERVTRLAEKYFPELCESNDDPRANLLFDDGIKWMSNAAAESVDIIIVDSTDPIGPATGLFSKDFYANCLNALAPDGILIHQSESPIYDKELLFEIRSAMSAGGFSNIHSLMFPQPCYPSGWWSGTMASAKTNLTEFRIEDSKNKTFSTTYYNDDIHRGALAVPEFMK